MKIVAIDTNVLLDFKLKRHPRFNQVKKLFADCANGKIQIFIPQVVFPEIEWVLRSFYKQPKENTVKFFEELLNLELMTLENKPEMHQAVNIFKFANIKFTDCIILAQMHRIKPDEFLTFDEDLQKFYTTKPPATMEWE